MRWTKKIYVVVLVMGDRLDSNVIKNDRAIILGSELRRRRNRYYAAWCLVVIIG